MSMSLEKVNQWLVLVTNLGVVAGFVLIALQLQQNTNMCMNSTSQLRGLIGHRPNLFGTQILPPRLMKNIGLMSVKNSSISLFLKKHWIRNLIPGTDPVIGSAPSCPQREY